MNPDLPNSTVRRLKDINFSDANGHTPLCHAVLAGRTDLVQLLLTEEAAPNRGDLCLAVNLDSDEDTIIALPVLSQIIGEALGRHRTC